ncbi:metal ABC transporter solute-binding protein, Zn/Mn family [Paenibacillus abyssi]|nr:zinc ABC transporter substrate-binding protein [Paenibacillus abyssi]
MSVNNMKLMGSRLSLAVLLVCMTILAACGNNNQESTGQAEAGANEDGNGKVGVVTTFYPLYYLASEIGGEHAEVVNLVPAGVEPHDWSPKSRDLDNASKADLFLYNGAGFEGWVDNFLKGLSTDSTVVTSEVSHGIELIDGSKTDDNHQEEAAEEQTHQEDAHADEHAHEEEGHADEQAHEEGHADEQAHEEGHADEQAHEAEAEDDGHGHDAHGHSLDIDPHTWVSPKSALIMAENIKNSFIEVDADNEASYIANFEVLQEKLTALDAKFEEQLSQTTRKDIVVSHQAFGYLTRDYGLNQVSIMGLSPDAEPRAQDLMNIANFVKQNGIQYIFFEELVSSDLADTLAREAKVDTLVLNPLEGLTPQQEQAGEDFISLMEVNLQNLLKALQ